MKDIGDQTVDRLVANYISEVGDFYELPKININIHLIKSRKEFDEIEGHKTADWVVGFTRNDTIYIFDRDIFEECTSHPKSAFEAVLKHEISHIYFKRLKASGHPNWLDEGVACFIAGQNKDTNPGEITIRTLKNYNKNVDKDIYSIGRFMVTKIIEKFGKKKLFELIKIESSNSLYGELKNMFNWLA